MRKLLLIASVALFGTLNVNAQCTPDPQYTEPGIYPDSATNFAPACVNQPYTQLITNVVPQDTTLVVPPIPVPITATIDSIVLTGVTGLPPGMSLSCNPTGCSYPGGTTGCAIISGTCTVAGTYNLVFNIKAYPHNFPAQTFTLDYYKIVVGTTCSVGIEENSTAKFKMFPNPASNKVTIEGFSGNMVKHISLTNAEGKIIRTYNVFDGASMDINMEGLNNGLYFVSIDYNTGTEVLKLIKE